LLVAAAILVCFMPTLRAVRAVAEQPVSNASPGATADSRGEPGDDASTSAEIASVLAPTDIELPDYGILASPRIQDKLGLTAAQRSSLRNLAEEFRKGNEAIDLNFFGPARHAPSKMSAKESERWIIESNRSMQEKKTKLSIAGSEKIERLLGPEKLKALRGIWLAQLADYYLGDPGVRVQIGASAEQIKSFDALEQEYARRLQQAAEDQTRQTLGELDQRQRQALLKESLRVYHEAREANSAKAGNGNPLPITRRPYLAELGTPSQQEPDVQRVILPVYQLLVQSGVCKQLGLDAAQRQELPRISFDYLSKFAAMTPGNIRTQEDQLAAEVRRRIESLRTPAQLADLNDIVSRRTLFEALADPKVQKNIGLLGRQRIYVAKTYRQERDGLDRLKDSNFEKKSAMLTPQQMEKLRKIAEPWVIGPTRNIYPVVTLVATQGPPLAGPDGKSAGKEYGASPSLTPTGGMTISASGTLTVAGIATLVDPAQTRLEQGNTAFGNHDFDLAIRRYSEAIQINPKSVDAYANRGLAHENKGDHDKAIADCSQAIRLDPKNADIFVNRGIAFENKGEHDKEIADCSEAIRLNPDNAAGVRVPRLGLRKQRGVRQADRRLQRSHSARPEKCGGVPQPRLCLRKQGRS
jgi:tetratricopeptide (TPR) repeat protein